MRERAEELGRDAVDCTRAATFCAFDRRHALCGIECRAEALPSSGRSLPSATASTPGHGADAFEQRAPAHDGLAAPRAAAAPGTAGAAGGATARGTLTRSVSTDAGIEAGIERDDVPDRSDHQAGADQQHDGQRQLGDDERAADALRAAAVAAARRFLERVVQIDRCAPAGRARGRPECRRPATRRW